MAGFDLTSGMLSLMDAKGLRRKWYHSPEERRYSCNVQRENILSADEVTKLRQSKGEVFERGVINVFKGFDWNYKR